MTKRKGQVTEESVEIDIPIDTDNSTQNKKPKPEKHSDAVRQILSDVTLQQVLHKRQKEGATVFSLEHNATIGEALEVL